MNLLKAAQNDDQTLAKQSLTPETTFTARDWADLRQHLEGTDLAELKVTSEQQDNSYTVTLTRPDGTRFATFGGVQRSNGCYFAGWANANDELPSDGPVATAPSYDNFG